MNLKFIYIRFRSYGKNITCKNIDHYKQQTHKRILGGRLISSKYKTILTIQIFTTNSTLIIKRDELHTFIFFLQAVIKVGG